MAVAAAGIAKEPPTKPVYCWQGEKGEWTLHHFKPLIKVGGGTVFAEMTFDGGALREVRVRRFFEDSELAFDYTFDGAGKLADFKGHGEGPQYRADDPRRDGAAAVHGLAGRG